uniref:ATP synthase CFO B chain subunit I n=1 Tax=Neogoniolithon spectabile TaxID=231755 RepID=A0A3G3MH01_9FLOR|nr:ATP synthase CFO B chain subunit I [Neogoniolithon spectabile]AYR06081.1 ATP synthase CFO B chain subunit I [Neogoniolithon spectabile]
MLMIINHYIDTSSFIFAYDFGFNNNFLEANVINIFLLLCGLLYILRKFLGQNISSRQRNVLRAIQESEERLKKAHVRYLESEKQFKQTEIVIQQIEQEAIVAAKKVHESILLQGISYIERLTEAGKVSISIAEKQVREQIQQQITSLAINQVKRELLTQITPAIQSQIVNDNIADLGDKL